MRDLLTTEHEQQAIKDGRQSKGSLRSDAIKVDAVVSTIGFPLVGGPAGSMEGGRQSEIAKTILSSKNVPYIVAAPLLIQVNLLIYKSHAVKLYEFSVLNLIWAACCGLIMYNIESERSVSLGKNKSSHQASTRVSGTTNQVPMGETEWAIPNFSDPHYSIFSIQKKGMPTSLLIVAFNYQLYYKLVCSKLGYSHV